MKFIHLNKALKGYEDLFLFILFFFTHLRCLYRQQKLISALRVVSVNHIYGENTGGCRVVFSLLRSLEVILGIECVSERIKQDEV